MVVCQVFMPNKMSNCHSVSIIDKTDVKNTEILLNNMPLCDMI